MNSENCQYDKNGQVRNENENVEGRELVKSIPMIESGKLIETWPLRGKNKAEYESKHVHLIRMSPANVRSERMLTYPLRLKNATLMRLRSCGVTSRCSQNKIPATIAMPPYAIHPRLDSAAVPTRSSTVAA